MHLRKVSTYSCKIAERSRGFDSTYIVTQSLEIVTHSLGQLIVVYRNLGPTTNTFVEVMRKIKETMTGPDKWEIVKKRVTVEVCNKKQ